MKIKMGMVGKCFEMKLNDSNYEELKEYLTTLKELEIDGVLP